MRRKLVNKYPEWISLRLEGTENPFKPNLSDTRPVEELQGFFDEVNKANFNGELEATIEIDDEHRFSCHKTRLICVDRCDPEQKKIYIRNYFALKVVPDWVVKFCIYQACLVLKAFKDQDPKPVGSLYKMESFLKWYNEQVEKHEKLADFLKFRDSFLSWLPSVVKPAE